VFGLIVQRPVSLGIILCPFQMEKVSNFVCDGHAGYVRKEKGMQNHN
jgi:hypothetical protein